MAINVVNKDLEAFQFQEGRPTQSTPVTYRPVRPLLPIAISPALMPTNSIQTIKTTLATSAAGGIDIDPYLHFRGVWNSFTTYNINDVVLDNNSSYVAIQASLNQEPDQGNSAQWALLGKNLNFRGVWAAFNPFRQANHQISSNGNPSNVSFNSNVVAGNTVFVSVSVQNIGATATPIVSDTQGNSYTQLFVSPRVDGNEYCIFGYLAKISQSGPLSVNVSYANGGVPGFACAEAIELTNIGAFDHSGTAGSTGVSGSFPAITVTSTNASEVIVAAAFADGLAFAAPNGYNSFGPFQSQISAWFFPSASGSNTVQFGGTFNNSGIRFVGGAATLFPANGFLPYNPYDVVEFNGSMYLCVVATSGSPATAPSSWVLFAQSTGLAQVKTANYLAIVTDEGSLLTFNSSSAVTLKLPATPPDFGWWISVMNIGTGALTINPNGPLIDTSGSLPESLGQNQGMIIYTDGVNYFTLHGVNSLTMPNIFIVSAPDGSGVVTVTLANQSANTFWGGPTSGGAAPPSFRLLVNADLPATVPVFPPEFTVAGNVASPAGNLTIGKATEPAGTVAAGPVSGPPAQWSFRALQSSDIPAPGMLGIAEVQGTLQTGTVSGVIRLPGNLIPPKGIYRVAGYMMLAANPGAGSLDMQIGWSDIVQARTASNGTDGLPADISTAALNFASGEIVIVSDGIHDITFTMTLV